MHFYNILFSTFQHNVTLTVTWNNCNIIMNIHKTFNALKWSILRSNFLHNILILIEASHINYHRPSHVHAPTRMKVPEDVCVGHDFSLARLYLLESFVWSLWCYFFWNFQAVWKCVTHARRRNATDSLWHWHWQ